MMKVEKLMEKKYKSRLARVQAERDASNEKLAEKDREITKLAKTVEELQNLVQTQVINARLINFLLCLIQPIVFYRKVSVTACRLNWIERKLN